MSNTDAVPKSNARLQKQHAASSPFGRWLIAAVYWEVNGPTDEWISRYTNNVNVQEWIADHPGKAAFVFPAGAACHFGGSLRRFCITNTSYNTVMTDDI